MAESDVTRMLSEFDPGDRRAVDALLESVYAQLHDLAEAKLRREAANQTLQATALVHEAYLKMVDHSRVSWQGRTHFFAVAAQAMHRLLIDAARRRKAEKRGGGWRQVALDDASSGGSDRATDVVALIEALERMRTLDPRQARVIELRMLGDLSVEQTADLLDVSTRTVNRDWKMGIAWLRRELARDASGEGAPDD
jgi:RNA polymerase sigma factor (TIGR02999 family)